MTITEPSYPVLHHLHSSMSLRVLVALEELNEKNGLEYGLVIYPRSWKGMATKSVSPLGKAPVLCIGPKPEQALTEARLVLQYLSDTYSKGIWEPAPEDKQRDTFFQEFANASVLAKVDFTLMFDLPHQAYPFGIRHLAVIPYLPFKWHMLNDLKLYYQFMEDALSENKPWFAGASHGLADFNMIFPMDMASQRSYFDVYKRVLEKGGVYDLLHF